MNSGSMHIPTFVPSLLMLMLIYQNEEANAELRSCNDAKQILYHCADGSGCIYRSDFCNGIPECQDGSDEFSVTNTSNPFDDGMQCHPIYNSKSNKTCWFPPRYKCDHEIDCTGGTDECGCGHTFQCNDGNSCTVKVTFCDNWPDCEDGTDEKEYNRTIKNGFQCPVTRTHITKICVLPDQYVCDGDSDCDYGIDECLCNFTEGIKKGSFNKDVYSTDKCFQCLDGSLIIPNIHVCDGVVHCEDLSDECFCPIKNEDQRLGICKELCQDSTCGCQGKVTCEARSQNSTSASNPLKVCLESDAICNDVYDCENGIDEKYCSLDNQAFSCYDGSKKIKRYQVCDGPSDCEDESDEIYCNKIRNYYCKRYRRFFKNVKDWNNVTLEDVKIREGVRLLFDDPLYTMRCDGVPLCYDLDDECNNECPGGDPDFCQYIQPGGGFKCPNSGSFIIGMEICDEKPTCNDTAPEESADELGCPGRFYCKNKGKSRLPIHIPLDGQCNGLSECDDQSDEENCNSTTHFYCEDGGSKLFVPVKQKCDGTKDCGSGADECQNCNPNPFSDDKKLISSWLLLCVLWTVGLFAMIGNIAVIFHQAKNLLKPVGTPNAVNISNRILVLNLSAADLLVGIYLVALGIKNALVQDYCLIDQEWRSSSTCSALGVIALIGTETSVFILMIMTAYRLYLVVNPFKPQEISAIFIVVSAAWILSTILSVVPLTNSMKDYFVSCVWFKKHHFIGKICKKELQNFTANVVALEGSVGQFSAPVKNGYTWEAMFSAMAKFNASYVPEGSFGYYSAHSVCLPRLFPDPEQDESWGYSLLLILLNFFAFLFILVSYVIIYKKTMNQNKNKSKNQDRASALQRKLSRIVITDFCCWMPICFMAFAKLAGQEISDLAYAFTAIILLPINSAMNPFLYSDVIDIIWQKMTPTIDKCRGKLPIIVEPNKMGNAGNEAKNHINSIDITKSTGIQQGSPMKASGLDNPCLEIQSDETKV